MLRFKWAARRTLERLHLAGSGSGGPQPISSALGPSRRSGFVPLPDHFRRSPISNDEHRSRTNYEPMISTQAANGKADALRLPEPPGILASSPAIRRPSMGHLDPAQAAAAKSAAEIQLTLRQNQHARRPLSLSGRQRMLVSPGRAKYKGRIAVSGARPGGRAP
jgi:hypothetical protein